MGNDLEGSDRGLF